MTSTIVYEDEFGEVIDRPDLDLIEIRWFDTTTALDAPTFHTWLTHFADAVEQAGRRRVLTDSTSFGMDMAHMDGDWRDQNIIPRYNSAGVQKFAFHLPAGAPPIGAPPTHEGPSHYPTAYFGARSDALAWLSS
ncbi:MAG: hypothetical protein ACR2P0_17195 [Acidimicrobiales bacterium]